MDDSCLKEEDFLYYCSTHNYEVEPYEPDEVPEGNRTD